MNKSKVYQKSLRQAELRAKQRKEQRILKTIVTVMALVMIIAISAIVCYVDRLEDRVSTLSNVVTVMANGPEMGEQLDYKVDDPMETSLGTFKITHYCSCAACCGKSNGITATGTIATADRTIGVDPKVIPFGSQVVIDGQEYVAEDTGNIKGNHIDVFVGTHKEAIARGVVEREVFVKK